MYLVAFKKISLQTLCGVPPLSNPMPENSRTSAQAPVLTESDQQVPPSSNAPHPRNENGPSSILSSQSNIPGNHSGNNSTGNINNGTGNINGNSNIFTIHQYLGGRASPGVGNHGQFGTGGAGIIRFPERFYQTNMLSLLKIESRPAENSIPNSQKIGRRLKDLISNHQRGLGKIYGETDAELDQRLETPIKKGEEMARKLITEMGCPLEIAKDLTVLALYDVAILIGMLWCWISFFRIFLLIIGWVNR